MILVLTVTSTEQLRLIQEVLAIRRLAVEVVIHHVKQEMEEQLLGRDSIAHHARHQVQQGLQRMANATVGVGLAAGIDMTPEGMFLISAAVTLSRNGRQMIGWSTPRLIPEPIGRDLTKGGNLDELLKAYRQQWKPVDTFSQIDIDELVTRHTSYAEALSSSFDGFFQVRG